MTNYFWQKLSKPIIGLAPMDGVTDYPMRQIQVSVAKPDIIYTEFVSVEGFVRNPKVFEKKLFFKENERPIIIQLFGYTPQAFYETISEILKKGFDGIDLNMGCPAKSVLGKGGGAALIGNYKLAGKIIEQSLKAIADSEKNIPLSVKTRVGNQNISTQDWISFLSDYLLSEVTIHGRTLKQLNSGPVNWQEIKKAKDILRKKNIICLGNGGVRLKKEGVAIAEKFGLNGVLIGQAALGNPWVFNDTKPTKEEILKTIIKHAEIVDKFYSEGTSSAYSEGTSSAYSEGTSSAYSEGTSSAYGPKGFVTVLKHFSWYPKGFPNSKKLKVELLKTKNLKEAEGVINRFSKNDLRLKI